MKNKIIAIIISGIWITISEFIRNQIIFNNYWVDHFKTIGLQFDTTPINGLLWTVWSFLLAYLIFKLLDKFPTKDTFIISWIFAFLMMWLVIYNLQVLPLRLLIFAIPLSLIEVFVAILITNKLKCSK